MLKSAALQQFHRDESLALTLINFINGADIGMIERRRHASFTAKTFQALRIVSYIFRQELQSHESAQASVFGLINNAHPAATKLLNNSIMSDGLANHG